MKISMIQRTILARIWQMIQIFLLTLSQYPNLFICVITGEIRNCSTAKAHQLALHKGLRNFTVWVLYFVYKNIQNVRPPMYIKTNVLFSTICNLLPWWRLRRELWFRQRKHFGMNLFSCGQRGKGIGLMF